MTDLKPFFILILVQSPESVILEELLLCAKFGFEISAKVVDDWGSICVCADRNGIFEGTISGVVSDGLFRLETTFWSVVLIRRFKSDGKSSDILSTLSDSWCGISAIRKDVFLEKTLSRWSNSFRTVFHQIRFSFKSHVFVSCFKQVYSPRKLRQTIQIHCWTFSKL